MIPKPNIVSADGQLLQPSSITSNTEYETLSYRTPTRDGVDEPYWISNSYQHRSSYVKYATMGANWWKAVHPTRCEHVLGAQVAASADAGQLIGAPDWQANEPDDWEMRADTFDALAVTTYFGGGIIHIEPLMTRLKDALLVSEAAMLAEFDDILRDPSHSFSLHAVTNFLRNYHTACRNAGLKLYSYEGGSHIVHFTSGVSIDNQDALLAMFSIWVQSDYCTDFFQDVYNAWKAFGDREFMQFDAVGLWGRTGTWGAYQRPESPGDKRTQFLESLANEGRFWGDDIPPQLVEPLPELTGTEFAAFSNISLDKCFTANTVSYTAILRVR